MKNPKKMIALLAAMLMLAALLAGCGTKEQAPVEDAGDTSSVSEPISAPGEPTAETPEEGQEAKPEEQAPDSAETEPAPATDTEPAPAADGAHITPIPSGFDPLKLDDCAFPVSFTNDDIELNDEGTFVLHMTAWEQELFDVVDISMLKPGDTITLRGKDVVVDTVERADNLVHINGGAEAGGVTLAASEAGGTFYESNAEVSEYDIVYTSVAQLTLPVDGDSFVYTDASDPEGKIETYLAGDLLTMKDEVDFSCNALNGMAHIANNQVVEITRVYTP